MASRAERRHHIARIARARRRLVSAYPNRGFWAERSDNELATRHPFDCGRRCYLCHMDKLVYGGVRRAGWKREAEREATNA